MTNRAPLSGMRMKGMTTATTKGMTGWVRNNCNKCVQGMVASFDNCDAAHTFVAMIQDEARLLVEFDTKAVGLVVTITNITGYPTQPDVNYLF